MSKANGKLSILRKPETQSRSKMHRKPLARAYIAKKVCSGRRENQLIEIVSKANRKLGILHARRRERALQTPLES